ncbi:MAG: histidine phosphatase family protein [Rhodomicrobium sp.]|nr:histidine phosphatase family protein [Rhodomicrobium sp.]
MLLLLARHGNTFETGDKVVWVGARTDLPLTAKGREQAAALGAGLEPLKAQIGRVISGPLKRTREHAEIAARALALEASIEIDERLREIDYGLWEGKSSGEIAALGGEPEIRAWNERGQWPQSPGWAPSEQTLTGNVRQIAQELAGTLGGGAALLITSNGILKFFLKLVPGAFEDMAARGALKVATGNCCALRYSGSQWEVAFWDRQPAQFALV